ncbi:MAG: Methyltransferase type 11 [Parcubacteria group bacterium GW2011_GWA2_47_10]|nr:MAG: Methyltransferase type 11 [Parcubacteria group bacterium GW2011_GWA2_47_10]
MKDSNKKITTVEVEAENLKYMWNRHPSSFLATYLRKGDFHPFFHCQHFFTRELILKYLTSHNPDAEFDLEEKICRPLTSFYLENIKYIHTKAPFLQDAFGSALALVSSFKAMRLGRRTLKKPSVLDIGCGSGNYFEGFKKSGLSGFICYSGIDISEKNIANANRLYPEAVFSTGNVCSLSLPDASNDIVLVTHVFEHLSPAVLTDAFQSALRVARDMLVINFFSEDDIADHDIHLVERYHYNRLARKKLKKMISGNYGLTIVDSYPGFGKVKGVDARGYPYAYSTWVIRK